MRRDILIYFVKPYALEWYFLSTPTEPVSQINLVCPLLAEHLHKMFILDFLFHQNIGLFKLYLTKDSYHPADSLFDSYFHPVFIHPYINLSSLPRLYLI